MNARKQSPTTGEALCAAARGEVVSLPGFSADKPLVARLRRASLGAMVADGVIPNPLLAAAQRLYEGADSAAKPTFAETMRVVRLVARQALIEPTPQALDDAGLTLTDEQAAQIYLYAIRGALALEPFRAALRPTGVDGADLRDDPGGAAGD